MEEEIEDGRFTFYLPQKLTIMDKFKKNMLKGWTLSLVKFTQFSSQCKCPPVNVNSSPYNKNIVKCIETLSNIALYKNYITMSALMHQEKTHCFWNRR
jgi:hypothetical protein